MKILDFKEGGRLRTVIALGHFDGVHTGHRKIMEKGCSEAKKLGAAFAVTTFSDSPNKSGDIYPFEKRCGVLEQTGVDYVIRLSFEAVKNLPGRVFFRRLTESFDTAEIITGPDYTFGSDRLGTEDLKKLCVTSKIPYTIMDAEEMDGSKISATRIKKALLEDISLANDLLGTPFEYSGTVIRGNGIGRTLGFPTANIALNRGYAPLKPGVYGSTTVVDGKEYRSITNYGAKPTFGTNSIVVETHIISDGSFDLYGSTVTVKFLKYLRSTVSFVNILELKEQLKKDREWTLD